MWSAVMNLEEDDKMRHSPAVQVKKNLNSIRRSLNRGHSIEKVSNLINIWNDMIRSRIAR